MGGENLSLKPLPGTAEIGLWTGTNELGRVDLREVIFPIVQITGPHQCEVMGTGFFILRNGSFITARHVLDQQISQLFGVHFVGNGSSVLRPIAASYNHPVSDICVGVLAEMANDKTGERLLNNTLNVSLHRPANGEVISTYSYPLHDVRPTDAGVSLKLQPDFYSGTRGDYYATRGPSGKLTCPYYIANLHLYGASSGGPVFAREGNVFAVASASYEGANDLAFLTPVRLAGDIVIPNADLKDGKGPKDYALREIVRYHFKKAEKRRRSHL